MIRASDPHLGWPVRRSWLAAVAVVAATYAYFLLFAEFALLELVRAAAPAWTQRVMVALGVGGLAGAVAAAATFSAARQRLLLTWGLRACAGTGVAALAANSLETFMFVAAAVGVSLGGFTVVLAASLRAATGGVRLGLAVGLGTGCAYACSNLPLLFHAAPEVQTIVAAAGVAAVSVMPRWMRSAWGREAEVGGGLARKAVAGWVLILFTLVWMDSAAFYVVQHTAVLKAVTWSSDVSLFGNAAMHLLMAIVAGMLLDRGRRVAVIAAATAALALACSILNGSCAWDLPAGWIYVAGVSLYSTVLVEYPARQARPWVAAAVFGVGGWVGSALGIGMAQDLEQVPVVFVLVALVVVALTLVGQSRWRRLGVAGAVVIATGSAGAGPIDDAITRGREVYIAEGCIHCHSQFIRPQAPRDILLWGPAQTLAEALAPRPPLFGTRRQGPDLLRVGNRRTPEWNRLHLISPQAISPGSRMPGYAYLFGTGDTRGDDLLVYLTSLGAGTESMRQAQIATWRPAGDEVLAPAEARRRFGQLCAHCHGSEGRGDGPVAVKLSLPPPDWGVAPWRRVPSDVPLEEALSRIIKFGLPGSAMAGHEYLPDRDVLGLARYVRTLHKAGMSDRPLATTP